MTKVLIDGALIEVGADALFNDDDTPLTFPTGPVFTAEDMARARSEEKDKLYGKIDGLTQTITGLTEQVGGLTAEQQREKAAAEQEKARLEEEARKVEEKGLDAATLVERAKAEWQQSLAQQETEWNNRFTKSEEERAAAVAIAEREREFNNLKDYAQAQVTANQDKIAPQLLPWIQGNTQEEIDAAIVRAVATTDEIAAEMQQAIELQNGGQQEFIQPGQQQVPAPVPVPALPGTRVTTGPVGTDPGAQYQQLTAEQIKSMPMDQFAKLRGQIGIGGQSNARGLFG